MSKSSWRKSRFAIAVLLGFGLTACSDSSGAGGNPITPRADAAAGAYVLQSVNANVVPYSLGSLAGYEIEYTSGTLTLLGDNTFRERAILTSRVDQVVVRVDTGNLSGRWQQREATVTLHYTAPADTLIAILKNGLLSYDFMQDTAVFHYVYKKQ